MNEISYEESLNRQIDSQMRKGLLVYCVLLLCKDGQVYSSDIIRRLHAAELIVVEGTLYPLLSRLSRNKLLAYEWQESEQGPPRKYYWLTDNGKQLLKQLQESYKRLKTTVEHLEKGGKMNEVTNIHLGRETFTISVDAYSSLQTYLHDIKQQVGDDAEEVTEEIELRMVELLSERGIGGKKVILPKDVTYLKQQLGSPRDFKDDDTDTAETILSKEKTPKQLFRNTRSGIVAGVASGLAEYTGVPATIYRIIFIVLALNGVGIIVYILLWILIPEAKTPADVLQMQGKPVTVNGLQKIVERVDVPGAAERVSHILEYYAVKVVHIIAWLVGIALILLGILGFAASTTAAAYLLVHGAQVAGVLMFPMGIKEVIAVVCAFVVLVLLSVMLSIMGKAMTARKWVLPSWILASIIGVFVAAVSIGAALSVDAIPTVQQRLKNIEYSTTISVSPFKSVQFKGSLAQYEFISDPHYSVEIRTIGHINTNNIKITVVNDQLSVDTSKLVLSPTECQNGNSIFSLCPYGPSDVEILIHSPSIPNLPSDAPAGTLFDIPMSP